MKSALANTPRKRGRPAASDSGSRKRKQPAPAATVAALSQPNLANLHPSALASMAQHPNPEVAAFLHVQQNQAHALNAGTRVTAHSGFIPQTRAIPSDMPAAYTNVIAADPGLGYGAGPSVAAMSNPALISYEYGHLYGYTTELGDNITDSAEGTSSTGQLAPSPFVMRASPMLDAQAQAQAQAQVHTPYLGFMGNSYFSGYDVHPPPSAMGVPTTSNRIDQQARGLSIHASGPFFGTNGQMFPAQLQSQGQYIAGNAVRQAEPMIPQIPTLPASKRNHGHQGSQPNASPQVVVRQHAQSGVPASKTHLDSMPLARQTGLAPHVDHDLLLNRPPLESASLTTSRPTTATSRLSPAVLHAPTPRTCAADSPAILLSTPPPPTSTPLLPPTPSPAMTSAPTPFASTSSELSSIPSESPTVAKAELLHDSASESSPKSKSMDPASPVVVPATAVPKPDQTDRPLFVSSAVYASVVAKLDQALLDIQQMTEQLDKFKLATPNPLATEGLIVSINNGLASAEQRDSTHQVQGNMLWSNINEVTRVKGKSEGRVSKSQVEAERDNLKATVVAQKEELGKVNFFLQQVMERVAHLERVKEFHLSQLNTQANEINTLRTELTEAHGKIAQMVAIRGVALAEVSPVGLAPPLERTNSSSAPTTPIYTPTMPLLPGPLATVDPPHRSITPVRSNSLPTSLASANGMTPLHDLTPRVCHNASDNISVVPAPAPVDPGSPWKNWLQLDTTSAV